MIYGQYGSGKTNSLFKLCFKKLKEKDSGNKIVLISANYCTLGQNNICEKFCEITKIPYESKFQEMKGYNKSAVEKYLKFYENKERYLECKGTAKNSGKKQFRFQIGLDQRRQRSSWA